MYIKLQHGNTYENHEKWELYSRSVNSKGKNNIDTIPHIQYSGFMIHDLRSLYLSQGKYVSDIKAAS